MNEHLNTVTVLKTDGMLCIRHRSHCTGAGSRKHILLRPDSNPVTQNPSCKHFIIYLRKINTLSCYHGIKYLLFFTFSL